MQPWEIPEFRAGALLGGIALVILLILAGSARLLGHRSPLPIAGVAFALAGLGSVGRTHPVPPIVLAGVAGVAGAAWLGAHRTVPAWAAMLVAAPFGWAIGFHGGVPAVGWIQITVAIAVSAGSVLVAVTDAQWRIEAPGPALLALSVAGVYATVPDTEEAAALLGVALLIGLVGWPLRAARLGRPGAAASAATLLWVAAIDGRGRHGSIVGSVACLGLLVGLPVGRAVVSRAHAVRAGTNRVTISVLVMLAQAAVVGVASRVAGLRTDVAAAALIAAATGITAVAAGAMLAPPGSEADPVARHRTAGSSAD